MSHRSSTIKVVCDNPSCNFTGYYYHSTVEEIKEHRKHCATAAASVAGNECQHSNVTITEADMP